MKTTFIATGDSFMTRRLPAADYEGFEELRELIVSHDVKFNNLEMTIHNYEGYPSAFSGGTWAMAEPAVLDDLNRFGFNIYNTANNHSGDYGHGGILATIAHLRARNTLFAGTGKNLFEASSPAYVETPSGRVAVLAACSTFHDSDAAGNQSAAMHGRPGLNPLRFNKTFHVTLAHFRALQEIAALTHMNAAAERSIQKGYSQPWPEGQLKFDGLSFVMDNHDATHTTVQARDMTRMENMIREAKRQADYVLVSIHSHEATGEDTREPAEFLCEFAHKCIEAGADAILGHGPHELRGIEIYQHRPIFYSLGNFIFEAETVSVQPADAYENAYMPTETMVGEYMDQRSRNGTRGYAVQENIWRSVVAAFMAEDGVIRQICLYPISLNMGASRSRLGIPHLSWDEATLRYLSELSQPFGTDIRIADGTGYINLI